MRHDQLRIVALAGMDSNLLSRFSDLNFDPAKMTVGPEISWNVKKRVSSTQVTKPVYKVFACFQPCRRGFQTNQFTPAPQFRPSRRANMRRVREFHPLVRKDGR